MTELEWHDMDSFPTDGSRCTIEFASGYRHSGWFWGRRLMGKGYCIRGDQNEISAYLKPVKWTKQTEETP